MSKLGKTLLLKAVQLVKFREVENIWIYLHGQIGVNDAIKLDCTLVFFRCHL
jgi:hypothetical protein